MVPSVQSRSVLVSRPSGRLAATLAVGLATLAPACGGTQRPADSMQEASNVPAAPSVDRTKCSDKGKQVITSDTNGDKQPDVWKYFVTAQQGGQTVSVLSCKLVDLNHDGKVDIVYYYDAGGAQTTLEEADLDFDGKFDLTIYYANGKKIREELDSNFDQKADIWKYYEDEKLVRIELDTNYDGKVDQWQYYEGGKLDRIGYDTSGSGRVDKWDRAPESEEPGGASAENTGGAAAPALASGAAANASTTPPAATTPPPAASPAAKPTTPAPAAPKK
ncbi:MAG TPA: hypothetical protein VH374_21965 [Polyangia bacterium]|jgi:hypothetical protein|nr:hypothetical protein [Polyangia bacterium]